MKLFTTNICISQLKCNGRHNSTEFFKCFKESWLSPQFDGLLSCKVPSTVISAVSRGSDGELH